MKAKFITVKGPGSLATEPFYMGVLQHERTMSRRETYEYIAEKTGYKPAAVRAVFMAVAEYIRENQARGNITFVDGVASIRNSVRGAFEGLTGPWVKGRNVIMVNAVEMEPFKTVLAAVVPENNTEGAANLHPCSHRLWRHTSFGGYAPSFLHHFPIANNHRICINRCHPPLRTAITVTEKSGGTSYTFYIAPTLS